MADILIHQHAGCAVLAFDAVADRRQLLLFFRSDIGAKKSGHGNTFLQMVCETFAVRSEEHTSELQSLMRISYAVFCLKKKTKRTIANLTGMNVYNIKPGSNTATTHLN